MNDPVLLRLDEDRFWLALADSDALLYAKGVAAFAGMDVDLDEADVAPMQVQGPRSKDVIRSMFGDAVADLRYYRCTEAEVDGIPVVVSRTGWTGEVGYEIYLCDSARGEDLWRLVEEAGAPFGIRATAPSEARRIEAGIFNYGSDFRVTSDTPFHVSEHAKNVLCPFGFWGFRYAIEQPTGRGELAQEVAIVDPPNMLVARSSELDQAENFIGKGALARIAEEGVDRKLVGVDIGGPPMTDEGALNDFWPVVDPDDRQIGRVTAGAWSPRLEKNIGYAWVPATHVAEGTEVSLMSSSGPRAATVAALPFLDPAKRVPVA